MNKHTIKSGTRRIVLFGSLTQEKQERLEIYELRFYRANKLILGKQRYYEVIEGVNKYDKNNRK